MPVIKVGWLPRFAKTWLIKKKLEQVEKLAPQIRDNKHFREILKSADPRFRQSVYEQLKPLLKFKAKPYFLLNK